MSDGAALRMVAFGVLSPDVPRLSEWVHLPQHERDAIANRSDEVMALIKAEIKQMGWKLSISAGPRQKCWVILGPLTKRGSYMVRTVITQQVHLKDACLEAVKYLDGDEMQRQMQITGEEGGT